MYCPNCGNPINDDNNTCPFCGYDLTDSYSYNQDDYSWQNDNVTSSPLIENTYAEQPQEFIQQNNASSEIYFEQQPRNALQLAAIANQRITNVSLLNLHQTVVEAAVQNSFTSTQVSTQIKPQSEATPRQKIEKEKKAEPSVKNRKLLIGLIVAALGISLFLITIVATLILSKGVVFLFDGNSWTITISSIAFILQTAALVILISYKIGNRRKPALKAQKALSILAIIVLSICMFSLLSNCVITLITNATKNEHADYCAEYIEILDVSIKVNTSNVLLSGEIKNTGDQEITYVKVEAVCKDSNGNVIDTDWTYAVGVEPLGPGETRIFTFTFYDKTIYTASVSVVVE